MNTHNDAHRGLTGQPTAAEAHPALLEVSRRSARNVKIGALIVLGLLIWWPLLLLAIAFVLPTIAVAAVLAAVGAAILEPIWPLMRRIRGRDRAHRPVSAHRLRP